MAGCLTPLNLCAVRITRLEQDGETDWGADAYFVVAPISIAETPTISEGQNLELLNGCGGVCASQQQPDRWTGYDLTTILCKNDFELKAALLGGTVVYGSGATAGVPMGWVAPGPDEARPVVCIEGWQQTTDGDNIGTISGSQAYLRHIWPYVTNVPGDVTYENAITQFPYVGKSSANNQIGAGGPFDDWLQAVNGPKGEQYDFSLPTIFCNGEALSS